MSHLHLTGTTKIHTGFCLPPPSTVLLTIIRTRFVGRGRSFWSLTASCYACGSLLDTGWVECEVDGDSRLPSSAGTLTASSDDKRAMFSSRYQTLGLRPDLNMCIQLVALKIPEGKLSPVSTSLWPGVALRPITHTNAAHEQEKRHRYRKSI